jgi:arylsulfatase A-like enzyme
LSNALVIFSSDNGPVLNDGYIDDAVEKLGDHTPWGPLRGGKYSLFEAGTRVPFVVYWKDKITHVESDALICHIDIISSLSQLVGSETRGPDSQELLDVLLGKSQDGREELVMEATSRTALQKGEWIMIPPYEGPAVNKNVNIELGNSHEFQLYNLSKDLGEQNNLAKQNPEKLREMVETFERIRGKEFSDIQQLELK